MSRPFFSGTVSSQGIRNFSGLQQWVCTWAGNIQVCFDKNLTLQDIKTYSRTDAASLKGELEKTGDAVTKNPLPSVAPRNEDNLGTFVTAWTFHMKQEILRLNSHFLAKKLAAAPFNENDWKNLVAGLEKRTEPLKRATTPQEKYEVCKQTLKDLKEFNRQLNPVRPRVQLVAAPPHKTP